ncbi:hypothetical protein Btru_059123 [Bulinus truncatus]|nr:hypothetical protein Btru_059123 [Bulinus truncatus]
MCHVFTISTSTCPVFTISTWDVSCIYHQYFDMSCIYHQYLGHVLYLPSVLGMCHVFTISTWDVSCIYHQYLGRVLYLQSILGTCPVFTIGTWDVSLFTISTWDVSLLTISTRDVYCIYHQYLGCVLYLPSVLGTCPMFTISTRDVYCIYHQYLGQDDSEVKSLTVYQEVFNKVLVQLKAARHEVELRTRNTKHHHPLASDEMSPIARDNPVYNIEDKPPGENFYSDMPVVLGFKHIYDTPSQTETDQNVSPKETGETLLQEFVPEPLAQVELPDVSELKAVLAVNLMFEQ